MSAETKIEWADSTFNPWMGCTKVSPACDHCYAAVSTPVRTKGIAWGSGKPRQRTSEANWKLPVRWNAKDFYSCQKCGWRGDDPIKIFRGGPDTILCPECPDVQHAQPARRRVFCASLADVFDNEIDPQWRLDLFKLIAATPNLDWLLLTKRIGNASDMLETVLSELSHGLTRWSDVPWPNVWLGITICNQHEADRDVPKLLKVPARVRFLSVEPMLEEVTVFSLDGPVDVPDGSQSPLHWIIAGGESGPKARPAHPDWFRSLRDQCAAGCVPFLFKQWGEWAPGECAEELPTVTEQTAEWINGKWHFDKLTPQQSCTLHKDDEPDLFRLGKKAAGNLLDGRRHLEWPEVR